MSRIKSDKVNLVKTIVVDFKEALKQEQELENKKIAQEKSQQALKDAQVILDEAKAQASTILSLAQKKADEMTQNASLELQNAQDEAKRILDEAQENSQKIIEETKTQAGITLDEANKQGLKEGFEAGYQDGLVQIKEDLKQKALQLDEIIEGGFKLREELYQASLNEIVKLVLEIAKKVCITSIDDKALLGVVQKTVSFLTQKDDVSLILSEKYSQMLNGILSGAVLDDEIANEDKLKEFQNFKIQTNSKLQDDTIIVETPKERLDASFSSQLNKIVDEFLNKLEGANQDDEEN